MIATDAPSDQRAELHEVPWTSSGPVRRAVMVHLWTDLSFIQWRYPSGAVQRLLKTADNKVVCGWASPTADRFPGSSPRRPTARLE